MTRGPSLLLALLLVSTSAEAHEVGLSRGEYRATDSGLDAAITLARKDAIDLAPALDPDHDGTLVPGDVERAKSVLSARIAGRVRVTASGKPCAPTLVSAALTEEDGLSLAASYRCPEHSNRLGVSVDFIEDLARGHRHAARTSSDSGVNDRLLFGDRRSLEIAALRPRHEPASAANGFVRMGAEHIATGFDHLLFLFALVLTVGRIRPLLGIVTAFTLGHSLTLAISALGIWTPPARLIEPAIALSIGYVAIDNLIKRAPDNRWPIALSFGTIHGFGFAGALTALELPRSGLIGALFSFNLGVELGQLLALALALPLVLWLRRSLWFPRFAVPALSTAILATSVGWFIERVAA